jgi:hypothetical protein
MTREEMQEFGEKVVQMQQLAEKISSLLWDMRTFSVRLVEVVHNQSRLQDEIERVRRAANERAGTVGDRKGPEPVACGFDANGSEVD